MEIKNHFTNLPIKSKLKLKPTQKALWVKPNWDFSFALSFSKSNATTVLIFPVSVICMMLKPRTLHTVGCYERRVRTVYQTLW